MVLPDLEVHSDVDTIGRAHVVGLRRRQVEVDDVPVGFFPVEG